jgi:hypothetical protein
MEGDKFKVTMESRAENGVWGITEREFYLSEDGKTLTMHATDPRKNIGAGTKDRISQSPNDGECRFSFRYIIGNLKSNC